MATKKAKPKETTAGAEASQRNEQKADDQAVGELPSFETSMERLSSIVDELEGGELSLEDSLLLFEEGVKLARASQMRLDEAEARVEVLLGINEQGQISTEELDIS